MVAGEVDERVIWPVTYLSAAPTPDDIVAVMTDLSLGLGRFCHVDLMIIE